ncbi:N5-glutamine methyltransferase family protein [Lyticum sinuosum]|uniref:SAM-dependent methyl-transferase domain protein n=1 Tax=Lyticum sinuosum TaxID=1332059 RepID=A0AAE4VKZ4_9RICK|nr:methyltransferase [Lyticum sinuosum]MDZ5761249.1 SAM-dependent methyl-transferase domain protein [Lyticum sinuosum]
MNSNDNLNNISNSMSIKEWIMYIRLLLSGDKTYNSLFYKNVDINVDTISNNTTNNIYYNENICRNINTNIISNNDIIESIHKDIIILIAHVLRLESPAHVFLNLDMKIPPFILSELERMVDRRLKNEPLAYIIGYKEFWSLDFIVNDNVLIPRSDSEILVESIAKICNERKNYENINIYDKEIDKINKEIDKENKDKDEDYSEFHQKPQLSVIDKINKEIDKENKDKDEDYSEFHQKPQLSVINKEINKEIDKENKDKDEDYSEFHQKPQLSVINKEINKENKDKDEDYSEFHQKPQLSVIDLGTGSGALIISVIKEAMKLGFLVNGYAIDNNIKALRIANLNAKYHDLENIITFIQSSWWNNIDQDIKFDYIIANPPYISLNEFTNLHSSIKEYEPRNALTDEFDGLSHYYNIIKEIPNRLKKNKHSGAIIECGINQIYDIAEIFIKLFTNNSDKLIKLLREEKKIYMYNNFSLEIKSDIEQRERALLIKRI